MSIKTNNFSLPSKEKTWEQDGLGWNPDYVGKSEGIQTPADRVRYGKGYSLMMGTCKKCDHNNGTKQAGGRHCDLPESQECIF